MREKTRATEKRQRRRFGVRPRSLRSRFLGGAAALAASSLLACTAFPGFTDSQGPRRAGSYATSAPGGGPYVVTFNIEYGEHVEQAATELREDPKTRRANVLTVQEVSGAEAETLARLLHMNFVYYPGTLREGDQFGNAILTRYAIERDFKLVLPHPNRLGGGIRIAVGAVLRDERESFLVYSVHNETFVVSPRSRIAQVRTVLDDAERRNLPVIVAGDFNTMDRWSRAETIRVFRAAGYEHASRNTGVTAYPMNGPIGVVLDHIFVRGFAVVRAGTRPARSSDHVPLFAELRAASAPEAPGAGRSPPPFGARQAR